MTAVRAMCGTAAAALVGAGLVLASVPAQAATSVWVRDGNGGGSVFNGNGIAGSPVTLNLRVERQNGTVWTPGVHAGAFALQYSLTGNHGPWTNFLTYCLEPDETLGIGSNGQVYQGQLYGAVGSTTDYASSGAQIRALYNNFFIDSLSSATKSAAFQVALWEIAYETDATYSYGDLVDNPYTSGNQAGKFQVVNTAAANKWNQSAVALQASSYLNLFNTNWAAGDQVGVILRIGNQDLIVQIPVPEPATFGLMGAGLIGLGFVARRRRRPV